MEMNNIIIPYVIDVCYDINEFASKYKKNVEKEF